MEEELKKMNDFRKTCRSVLLKFYRNTSNGVTTYSFKTTHSLIFYINSVIKFNLNYFFNSLYFFKLLSVTSVICVFVLIDNLSAKGIHFFFCTMLIFLIIFYMYMENKIL